MMESLVIIGLSLRLFSWLFQWNKFENWLTFDEVKAYEKYVPILWLVDRTANPEL